MILWIILFLLIVGISFILAYRSMKDYSEIPKASKIEYGLFLIRQTEKFNAHTLDSLGQLILDERLLISLERLFKGTQAALTIYGPKPTLDKLSPDLNLLELEDYTQRLSSQDIYIWEMGVRDRKGFSLDGTNHIFQGLQLGPEEQFFWQVVLGPKQDKEHISFQTQIRVAVYSKDPSRKRVLTASLQELKVGELTKIPRPFSADQMLDFYKQRSLSKDSSGPILNSEMVLNLLRV